MTCGAAGDLPSLEGIDKSAWLSLATAATDPQSAFRYLSLCSVDAMAHPQVRMVVVRHVDPVARRLEFHTDIRSAKWLELAKNPAASVLGFCPQTRLQLRLQGQVNLHGPKTELAQTAWDALPPWTRSTYGGGPPGDALAFEPIATSKDVGQADASLGRDAFGVIVFQAAALDWFQLQRQNNRRAVFLYGRATGAEGRWINP